MHINSIATLYISTTVSLSVDTYINTKKKSYSIYINNINLSCCWYINRKLKTVSLVVDIYINITATYILTIENLALVLYTYSAATLQILTEVVLTVVIYIYSTATLYINNSKFSFWYILNY